MTNVVVNEGVTVTITLGEKEAKELVRALADAYQSYALFEALTEGLKNVGIDWRPLVYNREEVNK